MNDDRTEVIYVSVYAGPTVTLCELAHNGRAYFGEARLHPKDQRALINDPTVGEGLALGRALVDLGNDLIDNANHRVDLMAKAAWHDSKWSVDSFFEALRNTEEVQGLEWQ